MNVTFAPTTSTGVSGSVTVASNAANSPATVSLTGTGMQPVPHSVTSNWTPSTSTVAGYNVYSSAVSGGPYTRVNSTLVTSTQYVDSTVQAGHAYFYVVTSVDPNNVESIFSNEAPAIIP
jgi:fibronectin type 3 domain-containing protein